MPLEILLERFDLLSGVTYSELLASLLLRGRVMAISTSSAVVLRPVNAVGYGSSDDGNGFSPKL